MMKWRIKCNTNHDHSQPCLIRNVRTYQLFARSNILVELSAAATRPESRPMKLDKNSRVNQARLRINERWIA